MLVKKHFSKYHTEAPSFHYLDKEGFKKKLIELLDKTSEPDLKQIFEKYRQDGHGIGDAVRDAFDVDRIRRAYGYLGKSI